MHKTVQNLLNIENDLKSNAKKLELNKLPKIIAVSKTHSMDNIEPLINHGHEDFGENKVQEAIDKWTNIKAVNQNIKLHMLGKLQTNKVKFAVEIFDFIHSLEEKLAKKISDEQKKKNKKIKIFIQINIGDEKQKSGIQKSELIEFYNYCKKIELNIIGLMCIPPEMEDTNQYFKEMKNLSESINLQHLSMGMSSDYINAAQNLSTYLRIGTNIFGKRNS